LLLFMMALASMCGQPRACQLTWRVNFARSRWGYWKAGVGVSDLLMPHPSSFGTQPRLHTFAHIHTHADPFVSACIHLYPIASSTPNHTCLFTPALACSIRLPRSYAFRKSNGSYPLVFAHPHSHEGTRLLRLDAFEPASVLVRVLVLVRARLVLVGFCTCIGYLPSVCAYVHYQS